MSSSSPQSPPLVSLRNLTVAEARARMLAGSPTLDMETVPLQASLGRWLAEPGNGWRGDLDGGGGRDLLVGLRHRSILPKKTEQNYTRERTISENRRS